MPVIRKSKSDLFFSENFFFRPIPFFPFPILLLSKIINQSCRFPHHYSGKRCLNDSICHGVLADCRFRLAAHREKPVENPVENRRKTEGKRVGGTDPSAGGFLHRYSTDFNRFPPPFSTVFLPPENNFFCRVKIFHGMWKKLSLS